MGSEGLQVRKRSSARQGCSEDALSTLQAELEIQSDAVEAGQKVVVVDDLLATGGERSGCWGGRGGSPWFPPRGNLENIVYGNHHHEHPAVCEVAAAMVVVCQWL